MPSPCEECKRLSKTALTASAIKFLEQRWLKLARSYEFSERLSDFTKPSRGGTTSVVEHAADRVLSNRFRSTRLLNNIAVGD